MAQYPMNSQDGRRFVRSLEKDSSPEAAANSYRMKAVFTAKIHQQGTLRFKVGMAVTAHKSQRDLNRIDYEIVSDEHGHLVISRISGSYYIRLSPKFSFLT